jgi:putative inorganic carbon (HCO3(-)) transporter
METEAGNSLEKAPDSVPPRSPGRKIARLRASIILERTIFYTLLILIVAAATPYGIVKPWRGVVEALIECGVFVLGILWMIEGVLSGGWVNRTHLLLLPLIILSLFAYAQTITVGDASFTAGLSVPTWQAISFDPYETRLVALKLLAYALTLGLLLRYISSGGRLRIVVFLLIGIGVASALFAILRQTTQQSAPDFIFPYVRLDRGYGQFVNRNHFAYLMEMALGLVLGLIAGGGVRRDRVLIYLAAALPIWTALVLSNSRGAILSMICQVLLLTLLFSAVRNPERAARDQSSISRFTQISASPVFRLTLGAFLLAATLIGVIWAGGETIVSRLETLPDEVVAEAEDSAAGVRRREIWVATWRMIKENALLGVGMGGYWTAIPQYHNASGKMTPREAHNDYLELLASGGIIGVVLGGWFIFLLVRRARERLRSIDPFRRAACFGAITGLFGIAVHSLVDFGLHIPINALFCLALVAVATVNGRVEDVKGGKRESHQRNLQSV